MKQITHIGIILILLIASLLTACNKSLSSHEDIDFAKFLKDPSVRDVNQSTLLKLSQDNPRSLKNEGKINLIITNQSKNSIKLTLNNHVQIFQYEKSLDQWKEITNEMSYQGEDVIIDPRGIGLDIYPFPVIPKIEGSEKETLVRVAVTLYVMKDGQVTNEAVSAFTDLRVKP